MSGRRGIPSMLVGQRLCNRFWRLLADPYPFPHKVAQIRMNKNVLKKIVGEIFA